VSRGYQTSPMRVGAPLPERMDRIQTPDLPDVQAELIRAQTELMHAIAMHRKAWAAMRKWSKHRDEMAGSPGGLCAIEADPVWKKRTGDVSWWRDEMGAQAATVTALTALASSIKAEPTPPAKPGLGSNLEGWVDTLFGWPMDGRNGPPTLEQYKSARAIVNDMRRDRQAYRSVDQHAVHAVCERLIKAYNLAHPE